MNEQSGLQVNGTIVDLLPNRLYRVRLASGSVVSTHVDGTLQMKLVRLIPGDEVTVKLSDVDPTRGRIIRRFVSGGEMKR